MNSEPSNINILSDRDAYYSILGYHYQFKLTFYHLLLDYNNNFPFISVDNNGSKLLLENGDKLLTEEGSFIVEEGEDYTRISNEGSKIFVQIKYHKNGTNPSEYRKPILELYKNFVSANAANDKYILITYDPNATDFNNLIEETFLYLNDETNKFHKAGKYKGQKNRTYTELKSKLDKIEKELGDKDKYRNSFLNICKIINDSPNIESLTNLITDEISKTDMLPTAYSAEEFGKVLFVDFKEEYLNKTIKDKNNPQKVKFDRNKLKELADKIQFINEEYYLKVIQDDLLESLLYLRLEFNDYNFEEEFEEILFKLTNNFENWLECKIKDIKTIISLCKTIGVTTASGTKPDYNDFKSVSDCIKKKHIRFNDFFRRLLLITAICYRDFAIDFDKLIIIRNTCWVFSHFLIDPSKTYLITHSGSEAKGAKQRELSFILQNQDLHDCPKTWFFSRVRSGNNNKFLCDLSQTEPEFDYKNLIDSSKCNETDITQVKTKIIQIECMECFQYEIDNFAECPNRIGKIFEEGCNT